MHTGSCLCGGVRYEIDGELTAPSVCHCSQCRKQSGHVWSSTTLPETALRITSDGTLSWYRASDSARRGFCRTCGAFLFWSHDDEDTISVSMGSLDTPTGVTLGRHIFTADKGDYYAITDDIPQSPD